MLAVCLMWPVVVLHLLDLFSVTAKLRALWPLFNGIKVCIINSSNVAKGYGNAAHPSVFIDTVQWAAERVHDPYEDLLRNWNVLGTWTNLGSFRDCTNSEVLVSQICGLWRDWKWQIVMRRVQSFAVVSSTDRYLHNRDCDFHDFVRIV